MSGLCHWMEVGAGEQASSLMCGLEQGRQAWRLDLKERTVHLQDKYVKFEVSEDVQIEVREIRTWSSEGRARLEIQCVYHQHGGDN